MFTDLSMGKRIKAARTAKGLTQAELARKLGFHPFYISELERDVRKPGVSTAIALSDILEVSTDYLLKGTTAN